MHILLTGASGFVGGRLSELLLLRGHRVRLLARETSDLGRFSGVEVARCSFDDRAALERSLRGAEVVIHCAGHSADWGPWSEFRQANITAVRSLLEASLAAGTIQRFLHVSTTDVYGYPHEACDETAPLRDVGLPYNRSKAIGDRLAMEFGRRTGLPVTVVRPATVFGPRSKDWVVEIAKLLTRGSMMTVNGCRTHAGLIYVDDLADAMIALASCPAAVGEAYNVRDPSDVTWRDYFDALADGLGVRRAWLDLPAGLALPIGRLSEAAYKLVRAPSRPLVTRHAIFVLSRDQGYLIDKVRRDIGFSPAVGIEAGLRRTLGWLASPEGVAAVQGASRS
jgi:polyketide synthase